MGNVVIDMSMSLDGYIAAPNDNPEQGLGENGMHSIGAWGGTGPFGDPGGGWRQGGPGQHEFVNGDARESAGVCKRRVRVKEIG